jgi:hypothetical protein
VLEGTVAATRQVDVPADSGVKKDGTPWDRKAYSYRDVAVTTAAVLDGEPGPDAIITVRLPVEAEPPAKGDTVRWGVTARTVKSFIAGRFVEWVVYDRAVQLDAAKHVAAAPLAGVKTA